jgi:hypothetical protein
MPTKHTLNIYKVSFSYCLDKKEMKTMGEKTYLVEEVKIKIKMSIKQF